MVSNRAIQSMFSSDHPEEIKVTITQEDVDLARRKADEAKMRSKVIQQQLPAESLTASVIPSDSVDSDVLTSASADAISRTAKVFHSDSPVVRKRGFTNSH